ncbi:putative Hematopoietic prostaglandin D synthase [Hypsibius exemplaris]|uniref:glutathione transferase n=1 Tax=Hypsibius exemplaris TaxID=2072580 RepID=A0A9X6NEK8_HYPEX|nr:putative Hematopoietic prostaglandin D synthase [Hypsibius exemplaris]
MDSVYKLVHFPIKSHGETVRFIFAYVGVEYEDYRVKREDWPNLKNSTPFRSLPYLEVDGQVIGQSLAILRFLARRFHLAGGDELEQARVDAVADCWNDVRHGGFAIWFREQDQEKKAKLGEEFFGKTLPECLDVLEKLLMANTVGKHEFFVGCDPTWADFHIAVLMDSLQDLEPRVLEKYPLLSAHKSRVEDLKGIKDWIAKRHITRLT